MDAHCLLRSIVSDAHVNVSTYDNRFTLHRVCWKNLTVKQQIWFHCVSLQLNLCDLEVDFYSDY